MAKKITAPWRTHTRNLFTEILQSNPTAQIMRVPLNVLYNTLQRAARRAAEIEDPELIYYFTAMTMYTFCDPEHKDYDEKRTHSILLNAEW